MGQLTRKLKPRGKTSHLGPAQTREESARFPSHLLLSTLAKIDFTKITWQNAARVGLELCGLVLELGTRRPESAQAIKGVKGGIELLVKGHLEAGVKQLSEAVADLGADPNLRNIFRRAALRIARIARHPQAESADASGLKLKDQLTQFLMQFQPPSSDVYSDASVRATSYAEQDALTPRYLAALIKDAHATGSSEIVGCALLDKADEIELTSDRLAFRLSGQISEKSPDFEQCRERWNQSRQQLQRVLDTARPLLAGVQAASRPDERLAALQTLNELADSSYLSGATLERFAYLASRADVLDNGAAHLLKRVEAAHNESLRLTLSQSVDLSRLQPMHPRLGAPFPYLTPFFLDSSNPHPIQRLWYLDNFKMAYQATAKALSLKASGVSEPGDKKNLGWTAA